MGGYKVTFLNQQYLFGLSGSGLEVSTGGWTPQAPWGYLSAHFPGQALGYNGVAYVGAFNYNLGPSPNLPQFSFVLYGISGIKAGNVVNGRDSDPALHFTLLRGVWTVLLISAHRIVNTKTSAAERRETRGNSRDC
jgi:hypothetical protein